MTLSQKIFFPTFRPLLKICFSWKVEGRENVPLTGPLILVANHVHVVDPIFLVFAFPRWITFMAKEELFRSAFLRAWLRWAGSLSIQREGKVRETADTQECQKCIGKGSSAGNVPGRRQKPRRQTQKRQTGLRSYSLQNGCPSSSRRHHRHGQDSWHKLAMETPPYSCQDRQAFQATSVQQQDQQITNATIDHAAYEGNRCSSTARISRCL